MERRRRSREEWRELLGEQRETGELDAEFAARHDLNASTLRWWRSELRREATERFDDEFSFVPVEVQDATVSGPTDRPIGVIEHGQVRFVVAAEARPAWVAAVLQELSRC